MIDLTNLITIHDNADTIRRHKRILEELFYLCLNESFEATISELRIWLQARVGKYGIDLVFPCIHNFAIEIRNSYFTGDDEYRQLLNNVSEKHNYYHPSFTRNYSRVVSDSSTRNEFNVLENILFFNNPIPESNPLDHFNNKSGYMEIADDEVDGPYIKMHFDLGTTRKEIADMIDKLFPETSELQAERYNIPTKQYRKDSGLRLKSIIHQETLNNLKDIQIALRLENEGLYGDDSTEGNVRLQRKRMRLEINRFSSDD